MATKMRPWEIVVGKLMAALSTMALLVASSFPVLAMVFVYGGITLADILILLLCFAAAALLVGSLGVCCSGEPHNDGDSGNLRNYSSCNGRNLRS